MNVKIFFQRLKRRMGKIEPRTWIFSVLILAVAIALLALLFSTPETDPMD